MDSATERAIDAVWRMESPRLIAALSRVLGDIGDAEDAAQDALVAALAQWPESGIPDNPGAWLMTVGRRRAVDQLRRRGLHDRKQDELARRAAAPVGDVADEIDEDVVDDDLLRLIFISCHPVLTAEGRVALTLRLLGGLTTTEIARALLVQEATVAQRIVRAKRTLSAAGVPFELPPEGELGERLTSVLEVIYLVFNEGYTATSGKEWTRPQLCSEAMRLGRVLAELMPEEAEVHGLVALMEIQASRLNSRVATDGTPILLLDQDRARWDQLLIHRGLRALARAEDLGRGLGPYGLQAAIAACHARAVVPEATDWVRIVALYDALSALSGSAVVELNRAVAVTMAFGAEEGLAIVDRLVVDGKLRDYAWLPSVHGDLLERVGRLAEARAAFDRAASLTDNEQERSLLARRIATLDDRLGVAE